MTVCGNLASMVLHVTLYTVFHTYHTVFYKHNMLYTSSTSHTGGALNLPAVLAGVVVAFLVLTMLIVGIIVGAVLLGRKAHKKETSTQERVKHQQNSSITKFGRVTEEQKGKEVHIYNVVSDDAPIDGRAVLYQGLDVKTLNCASEYTELKGGTYQELDLKSREEEHHYQRTHTNREREGCGRSDLL